MMIFRTAVRKLPKFPKPRQRLDGPDSLPGHRPETFRDAAAILPQTTWEIAIGIGGEICFGVAIGTILSFVFIAAQWAGDMIGHQMGLNISEVLDPQFGASGSIVGDMYFMLATVIFLAVGGHRALLIGVRATVLTACRCFRLA